MPETKIAQIFLTNQTVSVYKLLQSLASQQQPPININESSMETLAQFMAKQYNPNRNSVNRSNGPPCGRKGHTGTTCYFKNTVCNYCHKLGHIQRACNKKKKDTTVHTVKPNNSDTLQTVKMVRSAPQLQQIISLDGHQTIFEIDTNAGDSFLSKSC